VQIRNTTCSTQISQDCIHISQQWGKPTDITIINTLSTPATINTLVDEANGNTLTQSNNPIVGFYVIDHAGAPWTNANCLDVTNGWCLYNGVWAEYLNGSQVFTVKGDGSTSVNNLTVNGTCVGCALSYTVTTAQAFNSTTGSPITALEAMLLANTNYTVSCDLLLQQSTATGDNVIGGIINVSPASYGWFIGGSIGISVNGVKWGSGGATSTSYAPIIGFASGTSTTYPNMPVHLGGMVRVGANTSTFNLTLLTGTTGNTILVEPGSVCTYTPSMN
jgi:hypothetical protein